MSRKVLSNVRCDLLGTERGVGTPHLEEEVAVAALARAIRPLTGRLEKEHESHCERERGMLGALPPLLEQLALFRPSPCARCEYHPAEEEEDGHSCEWLVHMTTHCDSLHT